MKKEIPEEVRQFFADMGRKSGNKLLKERGPEYFRALAAKRKKPFGRDRKISVETTS